MTLGMAFRLHLAYSGSEGAPAFGYGNIKHVGQKFANFSKRKESLWKPSKVRESPVCWDRPFQTLSLFPTRPYAVPLSETRCKPVSLSF